MCPVNILWPRCWWHSGSHLETLESGALFQRNPALYEAKKSFTTPREMGSVNIYCLFPGKGIGSHACRRWYFVNAATYQTTGESSNFFMFGQEP